MESRETISEECPISYINRKYQELLIKNEISGNKELWSLLTIKYLANNHGSELIFSKGKISIPKYEK